VATRNAINVLIKLLGGAEMTAELKTLGASGEAAIKKIDTAAKGVSLANLGNALHNFGKDMVSTFERVALGVGLVSVAVSAAHLSSCCSQSRVPKRPRSRSRPRRVLACRPKPIRSWCSRPARRNVSQANFNVAMNAFNKQIVKTSDETAKGAGKIGGAFGKLGSDIKQGIGFTTQAFADIGVEVTRFGGKVDKLKQTGDSREDRLR
jgi:hypothetical protein